jgi:hypothetical protein
MDSIPLGEDESPHFGIPPARLVPEVDAGREKLLETGLRVCHDAKRNLDWVESSASVVAPFDRLTGTRRGSRDVKGIRRLTLAKLKPLARLRASRLLALDSARITSEESEVAKLAPMHLVHLNEGTRDRKS